MGDYRIAGRYEPQEKLGEGGMGVVLRALDVKTGRAVAIKLMKDSFDPVAMDLFTKEWRVLAEISHLNIVEVRDVGVIEENRHKTPFLVMPLLRGSTLADLIANASVRLTLERIVEITTQVCRGLQAAHQRGLVHRDLKPSNIFVLDDDSAKIIDFGVVHLAGPESVTGQMGGFQYMSPEQVQLKEITPASDLFSMGVILYEALTGRRPFARKTAEETMEAVIKSMPPPVSELYPSINQNISKVVHKCLAKKPIHRFSSARELADALQKAARNEPVFDSSKIEPRIERARVAYKNGDEGFASEILSELESEGQLDPRIPVLRMQIEVTVKQKKIRQLLESARARMEQDEIPLALDKVREVLELDAENPDALAMRTAMEGKNELLSYIADVTKRLEAEPDLERRVNIAREAAERYPTETQFVQQLKLISERRDLVNSIVAKTRQYEERGQYAEAIGQWEILRNIHPQYSGLAFELEQCRKKRHQQTHEEEHARLIDEIDALMENRAFAKTIECAEAALLEFPGDTELSGLRTLAEQGLERAKESRRLFEQGQQAVTEKDLVRATDFFRKSLDVDPRGPGLRDAVVTVLTERARALAEENWREAEPLYQEASELDGSHPAVRAFRSVIVERKRQSFVGQCLTECRGLVADGKLQEAAEKIRTARVEYPNDLRLEKFEADVLKDVKEFRRKEERGRDRAVLGENRRLAEQNANREQLAAVLAKSYAIRDKYVDDSEFAETIADIEMTIKRVAKVENLTELLSPRTVMTGTDGRAAIAAGSGGKVQPREEGKTPQLFDKNEEKTKIFEAADVQAAPLTNEPAIGTFRISIAHPRKLSKGFTSKIIVVLYLGAEGKLVRQMLKRDFSDGNGKKPEPYTEKKDLTNIEVRTRVQVELFSPAIEFSQTVTLDLSERLNCARFLAKPRDDCRNGEHEAKVVIKDCSSGNERYSGFIKVKVVDYMFDHVSRPFFSKCMSIALATGSFFTFILTVFGKLDQTLGIASGATAFVIGSALFGNSFRGYISHRQIVPKA